MDFGIQHATTAHSWKVAKRAEELGFTHAWFYDTQLLNAEMFAAMGAAAMQTSRIRLGTGVLIPSNRIAPVTASAPTPVYVPEAFDARVEGHGDLVLTLRSAQPERLAISDESSGPAWAMALAMRMGSVAFTGRGLPP
mgnify:CR=1 FL=1